MFYIRQVLGRLEFRPVSPYMGTAWYERGGWMLYGGSLPQSRVTIFGGTVTELPEPEPPPRVLSKLKLRDNLAELGLWGAFKATIDADASISERWVLAQDIREDDADFVALKGRLATQFGATGNDLDEFLDRCITEA